MSKSNSNNSSGIGFFGMLTILFIGLKLTGNIDWSWFWVLSPLVFSISLGLLILLGFGVILLHDKYKINKWKKKK